MNSDCLMITDSPQSKSDNIVILMLLLSGKFYAYGLLRTLNSRQNLRDRMDSRELGRVSLSEWTWSVEVTSQVWIEYIISSLILKH